MNHTDPTADARVAEARRAVHESLILLPAWDADRVRSLIADLETAVEFRAAASAVVSPPTDRAAETEEERADREETERDHARGDHTYCGITCEVEMPTEHLRNFVIAKGYPGTKGALDELLRRAQVEADGSRVADEEQPETPSMTLAAASVRASVADAQQPATEARSGQPDTGGKATAADVQQMLTRMRANAATHSLDELLRRVAVWAASSEGRDVLLDDLVAGGYRLPHACGNCEGIDPDSCLMNPDRPAAPPA